MSKEVLGKCPVCDANTEITRITCNTCKTNIEGHFYPCKFCRLSSEQKLFIDAFINARGNIKEVEKELGISYPTVKNRLEDVISALGYKIQEESINLNRKREALNKLNSGELSVEETLNFLKDNG